MHLRDAGLDSPLVLDEPSRYSTTALKASQDSLMALEAMNKEEQQSYGESAREQAIESAEKSLAKSLAMNQRLLDMQQAVADWVPPEGDFDGLKKFMAQQIEVSFDKPSYSQERLDAAKEKTALHFYQMAREEAYRSVAYYAKQVREDAERNSSRTKWAKDLIVNIEALEK